MSFGKPFEGSEKRRIFEFSQEGPESRNPVELITDIAETLRILGVNSKLCQQIGENAPHLYPLLAITYGRKLNYEDQQIIKSEGRGFYHDVSVCGIKSSLYVKGVGNAYLATHSAGEHEGFFGYPFHATPIRDITYDNFRINGVEEVDSALLEFVNAAVIFAFLSKKYGWTDVKQAIEAGVTIPIGCVKLNDLTIRLRDVINSNLPKINDKNKGYWQQRLNNFTAASVGLLVPSQERNNDFLFGNDENIALSTGKTVRTLLEMGIIYSSDSAHLQNIYHCNGLLPQADNEDLIWLANVNKGPGKLATQSPEMLKFFLIFDSLLSFSGVFSYGFSRNVGKKFWKEVLKGLDIDFLFKRYDEINGFNQKIFVVVAAKLMYEHYKLNAWEDNLVLRDELVKVFSLDLGLKELADSRELVALGRDIMFEVFEECLEKAESKNLIRK